MVGMHRQEEEVLPLGQEARPLGLLVLPVEQEETVEGEYQNTETERGHPEMDELPICQE